MSDIDYDQIARTILRRTLGIADDRLDKEAPEYLAIAAKVLRWSSRSDMVRDYQTHLISAWALFDYMKEQEPQAEKAPKEPIKYRGKINLDAVIGGNGGLKELTYREAAAASPDRLARFRDHNTTTDERRAHADAALRELELQEA